MKHIILSTILITNSSTFASVLTMLPSPLVQGGMIHINVAYNEVSGLLTADPEPGTPELKPLSVWSPGDSFDPASPWYATLDPSQAAGLFNSQFGMVMSGESDDLPENSKLIVHLLSATPGMQIYQWKNNAPQAFDGMLGTNGSAAAFDWNMFMTHPMIVMSAGSSGSATATLSFTLSDANGVALPGHAPAQATLNFNVVPEPSTFVLSAATGLLALRRRRPSAQHA